MTGVRASVPVGTPRDGHGAWAETGVTFLGGLLALGLVTVLDVALIQVWLQLLGHSSGELELSGFILAVFLAGALVPGFLVLLSLWLFPGREQRRSRLLRVLAAVLVTAVVGNFFTLGWLLNFFLYPPAQFG